MKNCYSVPVNPRVILLSAFLTPFRSGAEACAEEVALRLADQYDITIVTARLKRDVPKKDTLGGKVPVIRVGIGSPVDKWLYPFLAPWTCRGLARYGSTGPVILHAVLETFAGLALHFCRFVVPSAKRILTLQTLNRSFLKCPIIRSPHAVTAISMALVTEAKRCGRGDTHLIPNGIELSRIPQIPRIPGRLLFVGRLEKMKGVDLLLRVFREILPDTTSSVHLRIVGDGSERKYLQQFALSLGLQGHVTFVGRLAPSEVYAEYAQAEIFCGLSRSEALGNVFLEAEACGCAILATNVGGIPDIVENGVTGLLVPPDDFTETVKCLRRLLKDEAFRKSLGEAGKKYASYYDWGRIAEMYVEVYSTML